MKKNNAFTLIELLAVVIIIGLLAVLIIPRINSTIKDSRKNAGELSSYALVRESDDFYLTNRGSESSFEACTYDFSNNINTCNGFEFSGEKPDSGVLNIRKNGTVALAVKFGDYCYIKGYYSQNITTTAYDESTCVIPKSSFENGEEIYFDVATGNVCEKEEYEKSYNSATGLYSNSSTGYNGINSSNGSQNSCLKFYAFLDSEDSTTVNAILDHNTTAEVVWNSSNKNIYGPSKEENQILDKLNSDTRNWIGVETPNPTNYTPSEMYKDNPPYTVNYSNYKARLISAEEIMDIIDKHEGLSGLGPYFDKECSIDNECIDGKNKYAWLFDNTQSCTDFGCNVGSSSDPIGYWTSSTTSSNPSNAWIVFCTGALNDYDLVSFDVSRGVRPVVTLSKFNVLQ